MSLADIIVGTFLLLDSMLWETEAHYLKSTPWTLCEPSNLRFAIHSGHIGQSAPSEAALLTAGWVGPKKGDEVNCWNLLGDQKIMENNSPTDRRELSRLWSPFVYNLHLDFGCVWNLASVRQLPTNMYRQQISFKASAWKGFVQIMLESLWVVPTSSTQSATQKKTWCPKLETARMASHCQQVHRICSPLFVV